MAPRWERTESEFLREETSLLTASFRNFGNVATRLEIEEAYTMASGERYEYVSDNKSECTCSDAAEFVEQDPKKAEISVIVKSL